MFNDSEFEAGCEFTSNFLCNIYSKLYLPDNEIVAYGDTFEEMVMIQSGIVYLNLRLSNDPINEQEFFILPTYSYFGDYQILFDLRSQITYKAGESKLLTTFNLSKEKLLELMEDYPEARKFYFERAYQRRIEFRRRQKKFLRELVEKEIHPESDKHGINNLSIEKSEDSSLLDDDVSIISESHPDHHHRRKRQLMGEAISKNISKYFINPNVEKELSNDYGILDLEELSEDEMNFEYNDLLTENNKKISCQHAKRIYSRMNKMSGAFDILAATMDRNLTSV